MLLVSAPLCFVQQMQYLMGGVFLLCLHLVEGEGSWDFLLGSLMPPRSLMTSAPSMPCPGELACSKRMEGHSIQTTALMKPTVWHGQALYGPCWLHSVAWPTSCESHTKP